MKFREYVLDKLIYIILLFFSVITCEVLLIPFTNIHIFVRIYIGSCPVITFFICFFIEYYKKNNYYNELKDKLDELKDKYLISEIITVPDFSEGRILKEILEETGKAMLENVNNYKYLQDDYKDFIELWIHEIKLPISAGKIVIENNKSYVTKSINEELDKIENYVEQALFYARSNSVEKDYLIKKQNLKDIVNMSILKCKSNLLPKNIRLKIHDIDKQVYTDSKWCVFILNQIIQNSVKYSKQSESELEIFSQKKKDNIILYIKDNGIGIKKAEITRVFEKGFTGENGRKNGQKATGIGLYLCKKLCNRLGLGIELNSEENIGTEVKIIFPKNSFIEETIQNNANMGYIK